jgi:hypothetical protein
MNYDDDRDFEKLACILREVDAPPPAPRDEIWARIEAQRAARLNGAARADQPAQDRAVVALPWRPRRGHLQWGAALAAMLVIGIGLGRVSMQQATAPQPPAQAAAPASQPDDVVPGPYRLAATQHLQRTEALLTSLHVDVPAGGTEEVTGWARDLLTDTRLLLVSPAAQDPATLQLLEDLELLLSQIAAIPAARATEEVELIQDGLNQSDVMLRLRAATAVRRAVGT